LGCREAAVKMINSCLRKKCGLCSEDMPDTSTFANGLDAVEEALDEKDIQGAYDIACETAEEMLEDEGYSMDESKSIKKSDVRRIIREELLKEGIFNFFKKKQKEEPQEQQPEQKNKVKD